MIVPTPPQKNIIRRVALNERPQNKKWRGEGGGKLCEKICYVTTVWTNVIDWSCLLCFSVLGGRGGSLSLQIDQSCERTRSDGRYSILACELLLLSIAFENTIYNTKRKIMMPPHIMENTQVRPLTLQKIHKPTPNVEAGRGGAILVPEPMDVL